MREILFRGKRVEDGKWIYGYLSFFYIDNPKKGCMYSPKEVRRFDVMSETVGQYTGLTDKNGRRVFEGDICWFYGGEHYGGNWETSAVIAITDMTNFTIMQYFYDAEYFEVIGNVFDNPELLELDVHKVETAESE